MHKYLLISAKYQTNKILDFRSPKLQHRALDGLLEELTIEEPNLKDNNY